MTTKLGVGSVGRDRRRGARIDARGSGRWSRTSRGTSRRASATGASDDGRATTEAPSSYIAKLLA